MGNTRGRTLPAMQSRTSAARKPLPPVVEDVPASNVHELVQPEADEVDGQLRPLDEVLAELGGIDGGMVQVRRIDPRGGRAEFVGNYRPEDVAGGEASLLQQIQDDFGGGEYQIHVRDGAGFRANRRIKVAERKRAQQDAGAAGIASALERMQAQFVQVLQAVTTRPVASEAEAEERVLKRMQMMADIVRPQAGGGASSGEDMRLFMDTLQRGIELGKSMVPQTPEENPAAVLMQSLRTFEPLLRDAARAPARPAQARPVQARPAQAVQPASQVQQVQQQPAQPDADTDAMQALLHVVIKGASADRDTELYAQLLADQLGTEAIKELLAHADPVGLLLTVAPDAAPYRAWFELLRQSLAEVVNDDEVHDAGPESADGTAGGERGGNAHPFNHEVAGQ